MTLKLTKESSRKIDVSEHQSLLLLLVLQVQYTAIQPLSINICEVVAQHSESRRVACCRTTATRGSLLMKVGFSFGLHSKLLATSTKVPLTLPLDRTLHELYKYPRASQELLSLSEDEVRVTAVPAE